MDTMDIILDTEAKPEELWGIVSRKMPKPDWWAVDTNNAACNVLFCTSREEAQAWLERYIDLESRASMRWEVARLPSFFKKGMTRAGLVVAFQEK